MQTGVELPEIVRIVERQHEFYRSGRTRAVDFRRAQLEKLRNIIRSNDMRIVEALHADMKKPALEAYASEVAVVKNEIKYALRQLARWSRPHRVHTPRHILPTRSFVVAEPKGVVLIIAPWNYPFNLAVTPLISAMAAGNCAVVKPSEMAPNTSQLLEELVSRHFGPAYVTVAQGDAPVAQALLNEPFDHIIFTGSTSVGRKVMEIASHNLTPVTLELGGKSPCIVDADINITHTARRIVWGKFFNTGQTCIAPDYLLIDRRIKPVLAEALVYWTVRFFGTDPSLSPDYGRIINERHFDRLERLLGDGDIIAGGQTDRSALYIAPTIIDNVKPEYLIMQEEIFGPILPLLAYDELGQALEFVNARPKPLSLYFFSRDTTKQARVLRETTSGGVCLNDAIVHFATHYLPFGGVGESGMGSYHGKAGFDTFTHYKPVVKNTFKIDPTLRYEPYRYKLPLVRWLF